MKLLMKDKDIWIMHCVDRYVDEGASGWELTVAMCECEEEYENQTE